MKCDLINADDVNIIQQQLNQIDQSRKTILFIEPYGASLALCQRGVECGYNLIILTADTDLRRVPAAIVQSAVMSIKVDTAKDANVLGLIDVLKNKIRFDAVIPGFEYFVPVAAKVSCLLGLPGIDDGDVMNLRRKDYMRSMLQRAGVTVPNYVLLDSLEDIDIAAKVIGFPMVCKPVDAAGSVNVRRVNNKKELLEAASRILHGTDVLWGYRLSNLLLVEQYIEGKEYSLEGVIQHGLVHHFSVTEKFVSDQTDFVEIGHIANAPIEHDLALKMQAYVERVIKTLNANNCPFHAELRINQAGEPVLMEIAARLAGDKIGELINLSRKMNYYDAVYAAYLGEEYTMPALGTAVAGIRFFYRPEVEQYSSVNDLSFATHEKISNIVLYYQPGERIPSFPKPLRRLGHVIAAADDYAELLRLLDAADQQIQFVA
jgi:biotin carboxylase